MDKSLVSKATSADEVPTPGYMYNEIARITHASADACKQLEEFLMKRLKKDNVHQKLKVLRVINQALLPAGPRHLAGACSPSGRRSQSSSGASCSEHASTASARTS